MPIFITINQGKVIYRHLKNGALSLVINARTVSACSLLCQHSDVGSS